MKIFTFAQKYGLFPTVSGGNSDLFRGIVCPLIAARENFLYRRMQA
jgi:hypothetical protein